MKLPKIEYPLFDVTIPSTGKEIKMRPFLVKEEKLLLIAQTSTNPSETVNAITQVVNNCVIDEDVDVTKLPTFDIEYLFIKLRSRSVNNIIEVLYTDSDDGEQYKVAINLDEVEIKRNPSHTNKVSIGDSMGIILKYPDSAVAEENADIGMNEVDIYFNVLKHCLESVYDEENVYDIADYSDAEVDDFIQTLDIDTFKKVQHFLETTPRVYYETSYTNNAGDEKKVVLQNLNDFFMLG
jgi:hypothetical protein